ncbi:MAG: four-carbon acid sugar kinase family protein [Alicyclobacillus sp.]|nr:four-carbon acid sugar kinase family protein [Alicyclobacillus sp.]
MTRGSMNVLVAADDLTGGNGVAALLSAQGFRAWVHLGLDGAVAVAPPRPFRQLERAVPEAHVYDLATRNGSPAQAAAAVQRFLDATRWTGYGHTALRIDSTLRGPIAASLNVLMTQSEPVVAVVVPAHPRSGRTTVHGIHLVHGVPVHKTSVGADPFAPVLDSSLASWIGSRCVAKGDSIPLETVVSGAASVCQVMTAGFAQGVRVWFCDATSLDDIETLAVGTIAFCDAHPEVHLWTVDPGPFTAVVAGRMSARAGSAAQPTTVADWRRDCLDGDAGGTGVWWLSAAHRPQAPCILGISASLMQEAKEQMDALERVPGVGMIRYNGEPPESVIRRMQAWGAQNAREAIPARESGSGCLPILFVRTDTWESSAGGAQAVNERLAQILRAAVAAFPSLAGFYLSGGEAARAMLSGVGVTTLAVKREIAPITTLSVPADGLLRYQWVLTKGGTMGDRTAAVSAVSALYEWVAASPRNVGAHLLRFHQDAVAADPEMQSKEWKT